ncbi:MAG: hypothetical protein K0S48_1722 [Ramlibacter sp.]|jgi:hypothetical protein|nr:hypothetical protein [Ramlibacter sp.]MCE3272040.1 hypothetical protein [Ramlibacter sp.]
MIKMFRPHSRACFAVVSLLLGATGAFAASEPIDAPSRLRLARSAAEKARLHEVGLDFRDVYGVISAETSWVPRAGIGRNGVVSEGLGQFEPATARAVGLKDPNNAFEAVHAAARLLREAAVWSAQRIAHLGLSPDQRAAKLREGVSVYYNLSTRARNAWSGLNTHSLPVETQRHIRNTSEGARQADRLNAMLGGPGVAPLRTANLAAGVVPVRTAAARTEATAPRALGTIEWSGQGGGGPGVGRRSYVVFSNGAVVPQGR